MATRCASLLLLLLLGGCATVGAEAAFRDIESRAETSLNKRVQWMTGSAADHEVADAISELLAKPLSADDAVQLALLNNRRLQATFEDLGIAQADLVQAGLLKNPIFSGDLKFGDGGRGTKVELAVVANFLDVLFIPLRKSIAETELDRAKLRVSIAIMDLAAEVRTTYFAAQSAAQVRELRQTSLAASEASYDLAKRIHDAGNSTALDLANERALYEESKLNLATADAEAIDLREHLTGLLGLWGNQAQFALAPRLPDLPAEEIPQTGLERDAIAKSLDLQVARLDSQFAARQLGITKPLGVLSDLEVGAAAEREISGGWGVGPSIALPIPIFSQGQPAVAAASGRLRQSEFRHYALAVEIRSGIRSAYNHTQAARRRAEHFRDVIIPLRQQIVEESQKRYNAMQIGAFQLLQSKRDEIDAGRDYIESLRDYWLARSELDSILAGRFVRSDRPLLSPQMEIKRPERSGEN